jgi:hypothetical protein
MPNTRIQVYANPELKRRIELAAMRRRVAVTQYCREAVEQQLAEDDILDREQIEIPIVEKKPGSHTTRDLRRLREEVLASRGGRPIDLDIMMLVREERDDELLGVR